MDADLPHLCHLRLCRRDEKANALNSSFVAQIGEAISWIERSPQDVKVVLLQSGIARYFSAGIDIEEMRATLHVPEATSALFTGLVDLFDRIAESKAHFIGATRGIARGAGATLLLVCGQVIAEGEHDNTGQAFVSFSHPERAFKMLPWLSIRHILRRIACRSVAHGYDVARRYISSGEAWDAYASHAAGFVDRVWTWTPSETTFDECARSTAAAAIAQIDRVESIKRSHVSPITLTSPECGSADPELDEMLRATVAHLNESRSLRERQEFKTYCVERLCEMARAPETAIAIDAYLDKLKRRRNSL